MRFFKARTDYGRLANSAKILELAANRYARVFAGYAGGEVADDAMARKVFDDLVKVTEHVTELKVRIAASRSAWR